MNDEDPEYLLRLSPGSRKTSLGGFIKRGKKKLAYLTLRKSRIFTFSRRAWTPEIAPRLSFSLARYAFRIRSFSSLPPSWPSYVCFQKLLFHRFRHRFATPGGRYLL